MYNNFSIDWFHLYNFSIKKSCIIFVSSSIFYSDLGLETKWLFSIFANILKVSNDGNVVLFSQYSYEGSIGLLLRKPWSNKIGLCGIYLKLPSMMRSRYIIMCGYWSLLTSVISYGSNLISLTFFPFKKLRFWNFLGWSLFLSDGWFC